MKILINNEEVVCSNLLEIKEEMLTTSSTILNNCYPKSWELDKNYVSRFYYPKDYSKCLIYDNEIHHPAIPGETIKGNNFSINYDTSKDKKLLGIYGDLSQNGTPTPSTPIDIDTVTGLQKIKTCGKNLLDNYNPTIKDNTVTWTPTANGGTFSNTGTWGNGVCWRYKLDTTKTYTFKANGFTNNLYCYVRTFTDETYSTKKSDIVNDGTGNILKTFTPDSEYVAILFRNSAVVSNINITNIQLELGTTATTFEEYNGKEYEINLGKNLWNDNSISSVTNGALNNNIITTNTINSSTFNVSVYNSLILTKGTYTISADIRLVSGTATFNKLNDGISDGTTILSPALSNEFQRYAISKTYNSTTTIQRTLFQFNGTDGIAEVKNIMVEKNTSPTEYAPYFTPIELCKIGDYQDKIYKSNGKWYIEKNYYKLTLKVSDMNNGENYPGWKQLPDLPTYFPNQNTNLSSVTSWKSNITDNVNGYGLNTNNQSVLWLQRGTFNMTQTEWKTNFPNLVMNLYLKIPAPETTEITNTELINQLENFTQFELFEGLNNISNNGDLPGDIELYYNFKDAYTQQDLLFSGIVKNTADISLNPREPHYANLQVLDFKTMLSEGDTLNFVISNKTILEAIQMVIETITTYGVILGNVNILNPNEIIEAYSTADKTAYDVFQYLAEISQSKWTTRLIDENTIAVDFYDPTLMSQATDILYTKQYFEDNNIESIDFNYGTYDYRNKQTILSDQVYGSLDYEETILADGYSRTFETNENIGYIKSINVGGVTKTFGTNEEKDAGFDYNFYYTPGDNKIEQNSNDSVLVSNSEINVVYVPIIKGRQVIINDDEVERINTQTNRNGVISRYEKRNDILTSEGLTKIAQTYIKYKGSAEINLIVKTYNKDLFNVGQIVYFNAPIDALKKTYMVKRKIIQTYNTNETKQLFCEYELTSSYNSEREINYFDNQRNKSQGNIGLGQFITRNIDIDNIANIIFNNLSIEETTIDNTLNSVLNSPLNK